MSQIGPLTAKSEATAASLGLSISLLANKTQQVPHHQLILATGKNLAQHANNPKQISLPTKVFLDACNLKEIRVINLLSIQSKADSSAIRVHGLSFIQHPSVFEPPVTNSHWPFNLVWLSSLEATSVPRKPTDATISSQHHRHAIDAWACCNHRHALAVFRHKKLSASSNLKR